MTRAFTVAYRYYGAFLAVKVAILNDRWVIHWGIEPVFSKRP
jgi:hypothetical protein